MYRTLSDLAGLPAVEDGVEGTSLADVVRLSSLGKTAAFSQQAHCMFDPLTNATFSPFDEADACTMVPRHRLQYMGYSVRTPGYRYSEWRRWDGGRLEAKWDDDAAGVELYRHGEAVGSPVDFDATENQNLAGHPSMAGVQQQLAGLLRARFRK